jgi:hypothetical protein
MKAIRIKVLALPPSLLEETIKEYQDEFKLNSQKLEFVFYDGGKLLLLQ